MRARNSLAADVPSEALSWGERTWVKGATLRQERRASAEHARPVVGGVDIASARTLLAETERQGAVAGVRPIPRRGRRGRLIRRALVAADATGILIAFKLADDLVPYRSRDTVEPSLEWALIVLSIPLWLVLFKLHGLYDNDEERADHSTADEFFRVVQATTVATWTVAIGAVMTDRLSPDFERLAVFWALAVSCVTLGRAVVRTWCRKHPDYVQQVVLVGRGTVGQLLARKIRQHPEYGLDLLGFVDADPKEQRTDIVGVELLGELSDLESILSENRVDRIIVAFSNEPDAQTMEVVRALRDEDVIVDVVPRLFDLVGPRASMHVIEGLPLMCLPPARLSRSSLLLKRALDVVGAAMMLVLTSPLIAFASVRIKAGSPGPVLFRQERIGRNGQPFTVLKFRTMNVGTDEQTHRDYVRSVASSEATLGDRGIYKLEREDAVTPFGRWLRKTSLDELPQLINVLRGEMSLVGPRPCIPYELENFALHHHERFLVPQGMTGLWQVAARGNSTFQEALDMDVAYARGWSMGLDLRILLRTPFSLARQRRSTA
jgi:exopolysaccharide biosynthesis polyprenyl glycosylphosphotransferase